jgi:hypothetical protein
MGAWGVQPWDNDGAADWFAKFFAGLDIDALRAAFKYYDAWDEVRAACYVLQTLGRVYVWPVEHHDALKELLDKGIAHLDKMLHPPDPKWDFLELWGNKAEVVASVQWQLDELRARRAGIR